MTNQEAIEKLKEANGIVYSEYCGIDDDKLVDEVNEAVNLAIIALEGIEQVIEKFNLLIRVNMTLESSLEIEKHNRNVMINKIKEEIEKKSGISYVPTDYDILPKKVIMMNVINVNDVFEIIDKHRKEVENEI